MTAELFPGAYTEGFDRLSEAHFIRNIGLQSFAGLDDLWWLARPRHGRDARRALRPVR